MDVPHQAPRPRPRVRGATASESRGVTLRLASEEDARKDLRLCVREMLTRGASPASIRRTVTSAIAGGPFADEDDDDE